MTTDLDGAVVALVAVTDVSSSDAALLSVHLAATAAMVGLIWFVQIVHYPLFDAVGPDGFVSYETAHRRRTSVVVGPLMAAEALTAGLLVLAPPAGLGRSLPFAGVGILGVIHLSTVCLQVPRHADLSGGYDESTHHRLVRSNWIRTVGWSLRGVIAVAMLLVAS